MNQDDSIQKGVAAIIENHDGNFLLHLRDHKAPTMPDQWCLVGGAVEKNETPEDAIRREIKEETGLETQASEFSSKFGFNGKTIHIYRCTVDTRQDTMHLGEGADIRFFKKDVLLTMLTNLDYRNAYLDVLMEHLTKK